MMLCLVVVLAVGAWGLSPVRQPSVVMKLAPSWVTIPPGVVINDGDLRGPAEGPPGAARVGGLSGLAYDAERGQYYAISDDTENPRKFTLRMEQNAHGISSVQVLDATPLRNVDGNQFSDGFVDPEDIAFGGQYPDVIYWVSEAQRADGEGGLRCLPMLAEADLATGTLLRDIRMPSWYDNDGIPPQTQGVECDRGLEALALSRTAETLLGCLERPLMQDAAIQNDNFVPSQVGHSCLLWDRATGTLLAEYVYPSGPVPHGFDLVGLKSVMALDAERYLAVEIAENKYQGLFRMDIYVFSLDEASNIFFDPGTAITPQSIPVRKELVFSLSDGDIHHFNVNNYQGMTLGPILEDGSRSVVLISDDDFDPKGISQTQVIQFNIH